MDLHGIYYGFLLGFGEFTVDYNRFPMIYDRFPWIFQWTPTKFNCSHGFPWIPQEFHRFVYGFPMDFYHNGFRIDYIGFPMDFTPEEAEEIAEEIKSAISKAREINRK